MSRHTDPSSLDTNTRGRSPRPHIKHTLLHKDINKNIPVNLAKTATYCCLAISVLTSKCKSGSTRRRADSPTTSYDWLNLTEKASRVQSKLHEQHGPNGAASGWPATGARDCGNIITRWKVIIILYILHAPSYKLFLRNLSRGPSGSYAKHECLE